MMVALAVIVSVVENFLPQPMPGVKLGLANLVTILVLINFGISSMWFVAMIRVFLASLLTGTLLNYGFYFSLSGAVVACTIATIVYKSNILSVFSLSPLMAVGHSLTQVIVVCLLYNTWGMMYYLPITLMFAYPAGLLIALLVREIDSRIKF